jgi:hypothetical protein
MKRGAIQLLFCLILSFALAIAGAETAVARLAMAAEAATTTAVVICADGQARTVLLNDRGQPVTTKTPRNCATCPDCRQTPAVALPVILPPQPVLQQRTLARAVPPNRLVLTQTRGLVQARAPPKGF